MLEKFTKFNLSEEDEEKFFESFFREKQKREFIENWNNKLESKKIIDINSSKKNKDFIDKVVRLKNKLMNRASILIVFMFITVSLIYIFKGPKHNYKYEYTIKGNNNIHSQIHDLANQLSVSLINTAEGNEELMKLFKNSDYTASISSANKLLNEDNSNEYAVKIAIISAIKMNQYNNSYKMFERYYIRMNKEIPEELIQLFELNKKVLKIKI